MKKLISFTLSLALVIALSTGCKGPEPSYNVDFEADDLLTWQTICFDDTMLEDGMVIGSADKLDGKAMNLNIKQIEEGNTWWVAGISMNPSLNSEADFKDTKRITLDYTSTVEYKDVPFMVQLVWKDKDSGDEIANLQVDFPMEKTSKKATFEIEVPADITAALNAGTNMYLDWFMIGLADNAGDAFKPGKFSVDNLAFYQE